MRALPQLLANEFIAEVYAKAHLVDIEISPAVYFTDLDVSVRYNNHDYLSRGIEFSLADMSYLPSADTISFTIDNVQLELSGYLMTQEVRGKKCTIRLAAINRYAQVIDTTIIFSGIIDSVSDVTYNSVTFNIYNDFILWNRTVPRRIHQSTCGWVFKDPATCRYAGVETWCDKSFDRCTALLMTANFGGFRFLPSLETAEVKWGPDD